MKRLTIFAAMATLIAAVLVVHAQKEVQPSDTPAYYTAKCVMCHGKKAEKKFDATMADDQMVDAVLKGKKVAKPPHMPAYGEKGVTAEQAKALVDHMKHLKAAP